VRIGELASRTNVAIDTLRYYEKRGLLEEPERSAAGYRAYGPETVRRIRFIRRAQELGFTLQEIADLLTFWTDSAPQQGPDFVAAAGALRAAAAARLAVRRDERIHHGSRGSERRSRMDARFLSLHRPYWRLDVTPAAPAATARDLPLLPERVDRRDDDESEHRTREHPADHRGGDALHHVRARSLTPEDRE
jgi:DNA-binding transcriptional MerR regulator